MLGIQTEAFAGIRSWFRHLREDDPKTVVYEFSEDYTDKKLPQITIGWLPEDFEGVEPKRDAMDDEYTFSRQYETNEKRLIDFTISYMHRGGKVYISPEEGEELQCEDLVINGNIAQMYYDSEDIFLLMHDEEYGMEIDIASNIEAEEIIKIAENIKFSFD